MGQPLLTELAVSGDDELAAIGWRDDGSRELWMSRWDAAGQLVSEYLALEGTASEGHAIAFDVDGELYLAGGYEKNAELNSWLRKLDAKDQEQWNLEPVHAGFGVIAAVAVDPWGEVVTVATEGCTDEATGLLGCELVVRKHTGDGILMWTAEWVDESFAGPVDNLPGTDASLAIDRFGYIYVTAVAYTQDTSTYWWARKLHP